MLNKGTQKALECVLSGDKKVCVDGAISLGLRAAYSIGAFLSGYLIVWSLTESGAGATGVGLIAAIIISAIAFFGE